MQSPTNFLKRKGWHQTAIIAIIGVIYIFASWLLSFDNLAGFTAIR